CSSVVITMSATAAPGDPPEQVMSARRAPAASARSRARLVAQVPPSWLTPMTRPSSVSPSASAASNAWTETGAPAGHGRLGLDHLGHVERRAVPLGRHLAAGPRIGSGPERRVRIGAEVHGFE